MPIKDGNFDGFTIFTALSRGKIYRNNEREKPQTENALKPGHIHVSGPSFRSSLLQWRGGFVGRSHRDHCLQWSLLLLSTSSPHLSQDLSTSSGSFMEMLRVAKTRRAAILYEGWRG